MNHLPDFSELISHTAAGETHSTVFISAQGTPSARKNTAASPWSQCTRQIMELPHDKGFPSPTKNSCIVACRIVELAYQASDALGLTPNRPLINSNDEGEIVLEWWHRARKLTVYVEAAQINFVRVWGADISTQMDDGIVQNPQHFLQIWRWLHV